MNGWKLDLLGVGGIEVIQYLRVPLLGVGGGLGLQAGGQPLFQPHLLPVEATEAVTQAEDREEADTDKRGAGHGDHWTD